MSIIINTSRSILSKSITTIIIPSLCSFSTSALLLSNNLFGVDRDIVIPRRRQLHVHCNYHNYHNCHNPYNPYFPTQENISFSSSQHRNHLTIVRMSSNSNNSDNRPAPPFQYYSPSSIHRLDLTELDASITLSENNRQEAFDSSAKIKLLITKVRRAIEQQQTQSSSTPIPVTTTTTSSSSDPSEQLNILNQELDTIIHSTLPTHKQTIRIANLTTQFQEYARIKAFQHFLSTGKLLPPSQLPPTLSDEEYLAGAVIGLTQDLARYVVGRATARDVKSVIIGRDLVEFCLDYLMTFDFRNGMLRRRYDGVKYALKTCETVLYELSVTGLDVEDEEGTEPGLKKRKIGDNGNKDDEDDLKKDLKNELEQLQSRIVHRDELRETLIKRCRDAQKAAKQAIFALHRDDEKRCILLITDCEKIVKNDLNPIVEEDPSLYHGSYANVLEEYAEAKLFHSWLMGIPKGQLLQPSDFTTVKLEPADYLGGLCDLTGEIGRIAVQRGTKRDSDGVHFCLDTNLSIVFALETLRHFPSGSYIYKKMDQLKQSVEKLERMLYELSLVKATGHQIIADSIKDDLKVIKNNEESND